MRIILSLSSLLLALLMFFGALGATGAVFAEETGAEVLWGDVNHDGSVNKKDSLALKKYLADSSNAIDMEAADVAYDGTVNKKDSLRLKQWLAGWEVVLGKEQPQEPQLSEAFYGTADPEALALHWDYEDESDKSLAGTLTLSVLSDRGYNVYRVYYAGYDGILDGYQPLGSTSLTTSHSSAVIWQPTSLHAAPAGAVAVVACTLQGTVKAYELLPECKRTEAEGCIERFSVLSDVHVFNSEAYNGAYNSINGDEDLKKAVAQLNAMDISQISITGDLILSFADYFTDKDTQIRAELEKSTSILRTANVPVYVVKGNHDKMVDEEVWTELTGCDLDFYFTANGSYFVYLSLLTVDNVGSNDAAPYGTAKLKWLQSVLEEAKGSRVFLFMHYPFYGTAGLTPGARYGFSTHDGEEALLLSMIEDHGAVTVFNGHTHYDFQATKVYENIAVCRLDDTNCYTVHVPSVAYPRNSSGTQVTEESQGYIVEAYENGVLLKGYDFVSGKFLPYAVWYLDTTAKTNSFAERDLTLQVGESHTLAPEKPYEQAAYRSLDEGVATVDENGTVTGVAAGSTTVVATVDGSDYRIAVRVRDTQPITGTGTKDDPFLISSAAQFVVMQEEMRAGKTYAGQYVSLTADIDLRDCSDYAPSATSTGGTFAGFFDGRGHVIKAQTTKSSEDFAVPFFWEMTGTVINTGFDCTHGGCSKTSYMLARTMNKGKVVNCYVIGSMYCSNVNTTVICGTSSGTTLSNIFINVTLTGTKPGSSESGISMKGSGDVTNIFYVPNGCTAHFGETSVTSGAGVAARLNETLGTAAAKAGVAVEDLCVWTEVGGMPVLVRDGQTDPGDPANSFASYEITLNVGQSETLVPEKPYEQASYVSLDASVATVDETGAVTGVAPGGTTVVATVDGVDYRISVRVKAVPAFAGSGTKEDPYVISSAEQFVLLQQQMRAGESFTGEYFVLTSDIRLNDCSDYTPCATSTGGTFAGFLDGRGHVITAQTEKSDEDFAVPYFWSMKGTVINTGFACVQGGCAKTSYVVARTMDGGKLVNCFVTGSLYASNVNTTVICGTSSGTVLSNVFINVTVTGTAPGSSESGISMKGSGDVTNVFYVPNGCTAHFGETSVTSGSGVAARLNETLEAAAAKAGVDASELCTWTEVEGEPVLVPN